MIDGEVVCYNGRNGVHANPRPGIRIVVLAPGFIEKALDVLGQLWISSAAEPDVLNAVAADEVNPLGVLELAQGLGDLVFVAPEQITQRDSEVLDAFGVLRAYVLHELGKLIAVAGVDEQPISLEVEVRLGTRVSCSKCQFVVALYGKSSKLAIYK